MRTLTFELGALRCALALQQVRQVAPLGNLYPIPMAPDFFAGAMTVRGRAVPVLDLGAFTGLTEGSKQRVLVLEPAEADLGLLVGMTRGHSTELIPDEEADQTDRPHPCLTPCREGEERVFLIHLKELLHQLERSFPV